MFLLHIGIVEELLIVVNLVEIEDEFFALCVFLILKYFHYLFVAIGDQPDELGSQVVEAIGRVETIDGVSLGARFGGFRQGLLKLA